MHPNSVFSYSVDSGDGQHLSVIHCERYFLIPEIHI